MKRLGPLLCVAICLVVCFAPNERVIAQDAPASDLIQLIAELLKDSDNDVRALALEQVRSEAPGEAATREFASLLNELPPDAQVGLLRALAARGDRAARPAVLGMLASREEAVRIAALDALGFLGEPSDALRLIESLDKASVGEQASARKSLQRLPDPAVAGIIVSAARNAAAPLRVTLIEVLVERRASEVVIDLQQAAVDDDPTVRAAAMVALGQLAGPSDIAGMIPGVLKAVPGAERAAAEKAVMFVCQRIEDPARRAEPLVTVLDGLSGDEWTTMLSTLGRVGGPVALPIVQAAISDRDRSRHAAGIRAVANWPDASIAPVLMELAKLDPHPEHRLAALRALIRVAPLPDERSDLDRLALLQQALAMCEREQERKLIIERARAVRIPETLQFIVPYLDQPTYAEVACKTVVELAHHRNLREAHKAEFHQALDKVMQTSQDAVVVDRANRYQNNRTWVRPQSRAKSQ